MCLNTKLTFIPYILSVIMQQVLYNYFQIPLLFHLKSTQKWHTHTLSRPQGRNLGCLLWVQTDLSFLKSARNRHDTASPWQQGVVYCPACRTTLVATRFRVALICPIIQVPHCIRVFFYFVWFVFINHIFQFYYELCTYCNILDIYLS